MKSWLLRAASCTIVAILSLSFYSTTAHTETLEITLPNLVGLYDVDGVASRLDTFRLVKMPTTVNNVTIRLTGFHQATLLSCDFVSYDVPCLATINAIIPDVMTPATWEVHVYAPWYSPWLSMLQPPYEFETILAFESTSGATWDFLDTLEGTIVLDCHTGSYNTYHCYISPNEPSVEITWAALVIDGEFSVAVKESSWGAIKAMYSQ